MLARLLSHKLCHERYKLSLSLYQNRHSCVPPVRQKPRNALIYMTRTAVARPLLYAYSKRTCAFL